MSRLLYIELWDEDPEGFACEEGGDSWRYSWRPCCETVFLSLFHEFRELLAPLLVQMVRSAPLPPQTSVSDPHKFSSGARIPKMSIWIQIQTPNFLFGSGSKASQN